MWWVDRLSELHIQNFHVIKDLKRDGKFVSHCMGTQDDVNSYVHHRILKKNKATWSNCTAARSTLPYTFCWQNPLRGLTNDVHMCAPSVCMNNIVQCDGILPGHQKLDQSLQKGTMFWNDVPIERGDKEGKKNLRNSTAVKYAGLVYVAIRF